MRKINLVIGEYYHIYNRGTDKRDIFTDENDEFDPGKLGQMKTVAVYEREKWLKIE